MASEQTPLTKQGSSGCVNTCDLKEERRCNDIFFVILYLLAFGVVLALFSMYGGEVLTYAGDHLVQKQHKFKYALNICASIAGGSVLLSMLWVGIMLCLGAWLIWICAGVAIAGSVVAGFLASKFMKDNGDDTWFWLPATLGSLVAILLTVYICCIRKRIAFASANLQIACRAILTYPVILLVAFFNTLLIGAWVLVWSVATYAAMNHGEYINSDGQGYNNVQKFSIFAALLLVFFWTLFVVRNIVHVTVSGTVATWWYRADNNRVPLTTLRALYNAVVLSFGSICFGSLIVSVIETIKTILEIFRNLAKQSHNAVAVCLLGCLECIVGCISNLVQYFNKYAYSYVGIYGFSFLRAGKETFELFEKMGWSAIANDALIDNVLIAGSIFVGIGGAAAGYGAVSYDRHYNNNVWTQNLENPTATLGTAGLLIGFSICYIVMAVINSSVATTFVLFAEDPHSLHHSHPHDYEDLHQAWNEIYPEEYAKNPHGTKADNQAIQHT
ncbi:hypothetical protein H257_02179 [Aphanomyces astaci]|uniref:Choline transporter-like protein n=1 Tax=Aphanomyces astaci TaxID=112090 RepID=W4H5D1_APHAT|nr:hypothetical protein H257_02179 [Aphanomyces astaci]ETV87210.1 hypothetical protein H257_02179 [Aphanomyces astaci]RHY11508.1 hypothetical protein DYB36_001759 [Aphanomyces astaci]RHY17911.1 hypothetical protein DYB25_006436 [Aphanomyces astaci]RHY51094.1 hypothetical protein DYB34_003973 [Aphanomyces astaci]RHY67979.1 hypothetical protein DYB38_009517 [Aphanomyces astaci]|eukprot:XP_009824009.1 hypothetical protein H257_02179 [Aphanomyces astaci]